ncbi:MAG TPA: aminoacyl-tRNA hydrolase [Bdellovibrionota bacterium]|nr:aminoacyl-tRNA hydrolase [Bdellovibrionota bacterium]
MLTVCGLGNPGEKYEHTKHNIGFIILEHLAHKFDFKFSQKKFNSSVAEVSIHDKKVLFIKPQTFMNRSGEAIKQSVSFYKTDLKQLLVIHDEIDFPFGKIKLKFDGGDAGHNGLNSIIEELGTASFHRLRIGIGRPAMKEEVSSYVLSPFSSEQEMKLFQVINQACDEIGKFIERSIVL